jgi:hypothetical protein
MYHSPTYRLKLYRNFKSLHSSDHYGIVRFYEQHEEALYALDLEQYLDCTLAYTTSLFETGDLRRHNVMCDHLIQLVINENIYTWGGEDLFEQLLYKKALASSQLDELPVAIHVLRQLRNIAPSHHGARCLLLDCLLRQMPPTRRRLRAFALLSFLLAALSAGVLGLVVQPFFDAYVPAATFVCAALTLLGGGLLLGGELWYRLRCAREVNPVAAS